jgi:hypothetical protein
MNALKGCKLRSTDKQKSIYIKPSRKCMLKIREASYFKLQNYGYTKQECLLFPGLLLKKLIIFKE